MLALNWPEEFPLQARVNCRPEFGLRRPCDATRRCFAGLVRPCLGLREPCFGVGYSVGLQGPSINLSRSSSCPREHFVCLRKLFPALGRPLNGLRGPVLACESHLHTLEGPVWLKRALCLTEKAVCWPEKVLCRSDQAPDCHDRALCRLERALCGHERASFGLRRPVLA